MGREVVMSFWKGFKNMAADYKKQSNSPWFTAKKWAARGVIGTGLLGTGIYKATRQPEMMSSGKVE